MKASSSSVTKEFQDENWAYQQHTGCIILHQLHFLSCLQAQPHLDRITVIQPEYDQSRCHPSKSCLSQEELQLVYLSKLVTGSPGHSCHQVANLGPEECQICELMGWGCATHANSRIGPLPRRESGHLSRTSILLG